MFLKAFTDADNFVIDFNDGLSTDTKVLIVAATFLIDMMYFEMNNWDHGNPIAEDDIVEDEPLVM